MTDLLDHINPIYIQGDLDIFVEGIECNSSAVRNNDLFVAIPGYRVDGHDFIDQAIDAGAGVIIGEKDLRDLSVPYIRVKNSRKALAQVACAYYGDPSQNKVVIGITGTNGKTTTAFMIRHILELAGRRCAVFSTVENIINGHVHRAKNTTPDALELQKQLASSTDEFAIIEVSSHSLSQYRVEGIAFDYCLFTNLDHDHLDYHHDMDEYFSVKARLFKQLKPAGKAVINQYDKWGAKLQEQLALEQERMLILGDGPGHRLRVDFLPSGNAKVCIKDLQTYESDLEIIGKHNVMNACMAFLATEDCGVEPANVIENIRTFPGVPGRFEVLRHPHGATVVIDYAHTADALQNCLNTAREHGANKVFHIFGFRGNRDILKRETMIDVSRRLSDYSVLTFDDLNDISEAEMAQELVALNKGGSVITDRTMAIKHVIDQVSSGDWVIITGKGPESYTQTFKLPTNSDQETVSYLFEQKEQDKEQQQPFVDLRLKKIQSI